MNREFLELIKTRRSCRKYKPEQITDEELQAVLEAGTYAPTSRGMQSPYIVAVQNPALREQLAAMNARVMGTTSNPYYDAPTYVLVLTPADANNPIQDGSCVLENMMLAAHSIGLASCWIHRERENVLNACLLGRNKQKLRLTAIRILIIRVHRSCIQSCLRIICHISQIFFHQRIKNIIYRFHHFPAAYGNFRCRSMRC